MTTIVEVKPLVVTRGELTLPLCKGLVSSSLTTGNVLWTSASVLSSFLELELQRVLLSSSLAASDDIDRVIDVRGMRVLELGAGLGLSGITAALLGAREVVFTDGNEDLSLLRKNIEIAREAMTSSLVVAPSDLPMMDARQLLWGEDGASVESELMRTEGFDLIIAADVIYEPRFIRPLLQTMYNLSSPSSSSSANKQPAEVLLFYEKHDLEAIKELERVLPDYFVVQTIPVERLHQEHREGFEKGILQALRLTRLEVSRDTLKQLAVANIVGKGEGVGSFALPPPPRRRV